jgi:hypothetical protein
MRSPTISEAERIAITVACQRFIDEFLKPRFLPVICPTKFNYPIDILGKWHGTRYRFIQRYRSGFPDNFGEEFDRPFVRLDWLAGITSISNGIGIPVLGTVSIVVCPLPRHSTPFNRTGFYTRFERPR